MVNLDSVKLLASKLHGLQSKASLRTQSFKPISLLRQIEDESVFSKNVHTLIKHQLKDLTVGLLLVSINIIFVKTPAHTSIESDIYLTRVQLISKKW